MSRARRIKPSTAAGRKRQAELGKIISNPRTPKAERAAALEELDRLAPFEGSGSLTDSGSSLEIREPRPTTSDNLALVARVEAARKTVPVFPSFTLDAAASRESAIRKAASATPQEKAVVILSDLPEHPLCKLAAELAQYLWLEDRSSPKPPVERLAANYVRHWLSDEPWNRHDIRGSRATVDAAVASALKLVADLDAADPDWFARRAEQLLDAPPTVAKPVVPSQAIQAKDPVETTSIPANTEPELNPVVRASAELAARAALVLRTDSWLSRLAEHSPEMRTRILGSLSGELLRAGFVNGDFATRLYNENRPRSLSQFPPRQF